MNREPVQIMLAPIHASMVRSWLDQVFDDAVHPGMVVDFEDRPLLAQVLKEVAKQINDDLTRPCVECTRKQLTDGTWGEPRREALALLTSMEPSDARWVRQDIVNQTVAGSDPTMNYALKCGHWVIDL